MTFGDDADTVGAVTGQLAGALYGASAIPERWLHPLAWRDAIIAQAISSSPSIPHTPDGAKTRYDRDAHHSPL
ncbi:ADP-ribosylglycohydrolase family protein [Methylobacterium sp. WL64]|uniref:ADP-ribosylglycohydrolase family protein n=1 Tax=Methylobacterium sp. WL64 TaxID=2603894 RepID=UPI001FF063B9|nr:ADP-ribosylglycohydrolase family protein [Methylobacterium sp. WL64]